MKKTTRLVVWGFLIVFSGAFIFRCNQGSDLTPKKNQPDLTSAEVDRLILLDTNYLYPVASATKDAIKIAADLDQEDARKGNNIKRSIGQVISYSIPDTIKFPKSTNRKNDPGFYVFNFSNNNGFAIISGDERVMGVLGSSGKGVIDNSENSPSTGLRFFMSRVVDHIQSRRMAVESMRGDSAYVNLIHKLNSFHLKNDPTQRDASAQQTVPCNQAQQARTSSTPCNQGCTLTPITSLLSTSTSTNTIVSPIIQTQWDQIPPYNNNFASGSNLISGGCSPRYGYCQSINSNYYAGCVPVSEAQVVANYFARKNAAWASITSTDICSMNATQVGQVASLIKGVYNLYDIKFMSCQQGTATFDNSFFGMTDDNAISPINGLVQGEWRGYNNGDLEASLKQNSPVLVIGSQHQWCVFFNWGCGPDLTCMHQWIMDGMQTVNQVYTYSVLPVNYASCSYLPSYTYTTNTILSTNIHNNWGWGPYGGNGWYTEGAFGGPGANPPANNAFNHNDKIIAYITAL